MAEPITNLTAVWGANHGITLSWTAATDVTTASKYLVYIFDPNFLIPDWALWKTIYPTPVKIAGNTSYTLADPGTTYFFPWSDLISFGRSNLPPASVSFKIVHMDADKNLSTSVGVTNYPSSIRNIIGAPHLQNDFNFDSFGQALVNGQDSYEEVADSVSMLLGTSFGQRVAVPSYGIEEMPLTEINASLVEIAIRRWEPRAIPIVTVTYDQQNIASLNVVIKTSR
jgi:phage baseplate assembly protein W